MVRVEPFVYQKITAFKERVQMVNKINEIVDSLNGVFDEAQVKEYVTNELLNYYTKEEVDNAIDSIDLTPYATKTYVDDAIDSIDLTPYATNDRVNEEVETLDNKIDTKQNILTPISPIEISNDEIRLNDWVNVSVADLPTLVSNQKLLNDVSLVFVMSDSSGVRNKYYQFIVPKGSVTSNYLIFDIPNEYSNNSVFYFRRFTFTISTLFTVASPINVNSLDLHISISTDDTMTISTNERTNFQFYKRDSSNDIGTINGIYYFKRV